MSRYQRTPQLQVPGDDPRDPSTIARRMALFDQRLRRAHLLGRRDRVRQRHGTRRTRPTERTAAAFSAKA